MRGPQNPQPKPFFWISLRGEPTKDKPAHHLQFVGFSGRMELEIEVVSEYLFVGGGQIDLFKNEGREQAYYVFARRGDQLIIPGTSIKGAVRSVAEALSNSCVKVRARDEKIRSSHEACRDEKELCPACRLLGTTGYRGRVHFTDAIPVGEVQTHYIKIADLWPPHQARGRKFYYSKQFQKLDMQPERNHRFLEAVPKGSKFRTVLYFENTSNAEMGLLIRTLGLDRSTQDKIEYVFPIKLGGAKPRCLGSVRFIPRGLWLIQAGPDLLTSLAGGGVKTTITESLLAWLKDMSLLDQEAWKRFRQEAKLITEESCPQGVY
ncbi:MAG: RAMP superfamily CRISPR-associated protein [Anaerolineae bacterium]|nr:RAMP superfamily CRISPR-associated protein [Anaerolineae bacterium]